MVKDVSGVSMADLRVFFGSRGFPLDLTRESVLEIALELLRNGFPPDPSELAHEVFMYFEAADQELYDRVPEVVDIIDDVLENLLNHEVKDFHSLVFTAFYYEVEQLVALLLDYLGALDQDQN